MSRPAQNYLAIIALLLGALAVVAGSPQRSGSGRVDVASLAAVVQREEDHVTALELAEWIRDARADLRIVDVRDSAEFEAYHIPRAERIPIDALSSAPFRAGETIVLYSDGGAHAAQGWVFLRALGHEKVYFLRGGLYEWLDEVMNPALAADASDSMRARFEKTAEISRYFGGVPRIGKAVSSRPQATLPADRNAANTNTAVSRIRGRGC